MKRFSILAGREIELADAEVERRAAQLATAGERRSAGLSESEIERRHAQMVAAAERLLALGAARPKKTLYELVVMRDGNGLISRIVPREIKVIDDSTD